MISSHLIWNSEDVKKSRKEWLFKKETLMRAFEVFNKKVGMESDKQLKFSKSSFTLYYEIYVFNLFMSSFIDANRSLSHILKNFFFSKIASIHFLFIKGIYSSTLTNCCYLLWDIQKDHLSTMNNAELIYEIILKNHQIIVSF